MTHPKETERAAKGLYFQHDSDAHADDRIVAMMAVYGNAGYGMYWILLEYMRKLPDFKLRIGGKYGLTTVAKMLHERCEHVEQWLNDCIEHFVDMNGKGLFIRDGDYIFSESFIRRMDAIRTRSEKNSRAGQISAAKKAEKEANQQRVNERSTQNQQAFNLSKSKLKLNTNNNSINNNKDDDVVSDGKTETPPPKTKRTKKTGAFICDDGPMIMSVYYSNEQFKEAWDAYTQARALHGLNLTERTTKMMLKELVNLAGTNTETAVRIVNRATIGGADGKPYLFLYPVSNPGTTGTQKPTQGKVNDAYTNAANNIS